MSLMPPFEATSIQTVDHGEPPRDTRVEYVSREEAQPEDRLTFLDIGAIVCGFAFAQLVRLAIIFGSVAIVILAFFIGSKL